ncbi:MAG: glutathione S-transferase family protein [Alphaproteobacteria bacterium]
MSGLTIYGIPTSRAMRSVWMAEELHQEIGLEYKNIPTHFIDESKEPEYLAINPNGRVPAMDDDGLILFESLAINLYLAKKHAGSALSPRDIEEEAKTTQWSFWAITELEPNIIALVVRHPKIAMAPPNQEIEDGARDALERPLKVLDAHLADRDWLIADRFTVADLNVSAVMSLSKFIDLDFSNYPNVQDWFGRCLARPAYAAVQNK